MALGVMLEEWRKMDYPTGYGIGFHMEVGSMDGHEENDSGEGGEEQKRPG